MAIKLENFNIPNKAQIALEYPSPPFKKTYSVLYIAKDSPKKNRKVNGEKEFKSRKTAIDFINKLKRYNN